MFHGSESVSFLGPKMWYLVPNKLKSISNLAVIKNVVQHGHQGNALVDFVKFMLVMSVLFEKGAR